MSKNYNKFATQLEQELDTVQGIAQELLLEINVKLPAGCYCDRRSKRKSLH